MSRRAQDWPPSCPNEAAHATDVDSYADAVRKSHTHDQQRCEGCGLWKIWVPLEPGQLAVCWWCTNRNVDPTTLAEGDEPYCPGCVVEQTALEEERRRASETAQVARRWADAT